MPLYLPPGLSNPMTTGGDIIYGGASGVPTRLANGSAGQVLQSAGGTSAPTWGSASSAFNITSQSTTYSASINDYILASGASFTITLPTAVGASGRQIVIQHNGTSLSQLYTLGTTSSQTIGGIASLGYVLYTTGETLNLVSDGSNWQILDHKTNTKQVGFTPTFTNYGTVTSIGFTWQRIGNEMHVLGNAVSGTTAGALGSITLPGSMNIDTAAINFNNATGSAGVKVGTFGSNKINGAGPLVTATGTSTTLVYSGDVFANASQLTPANASSGVASTTSFSMEFWVPILGWQP